MVAVERLGPGDLWELSQRTDGLGVLSVYVSVDRRRDPNLQGAAIDVKNRYRELQQAIAEDTGSDQRRAVSAALQRLAPQVENLTTAAASGRSRIAFLALSGDWALELESAMPVPNRVVLDDGPFIHPLLELLDEGRPAGVVLVSTEEARFLQWRVGSVQPLSRMEHEYAEAAHERAGQIGGGPQGQFNSPVREQRKARERDRTQRFLERVAAVAADFTAERGWERILVSGGDQWTEPAIAKFPEALRDRVFGDSRVLGGLDDASLAEVVNEWARSQHGAYERQLVARLRDAAGRGAGVLGLSEVAAALNAGRVTHLVYDPEVRYTGSVGDDGTLYGGTEVGPGPGGQPPAADPRLTERLVEQALKTGARISPVEGAASGDLSDVNGIAALLRW